jgi:hypothetical protein
LDVAGNINADGVIVSQANDTTTYGYTVVAQGTTANTGYIEFRAAGTTRRGYIGYADSGNNYWSAEAGTGIILQTAAANRLTVDVNGQVIIANYMTTPNQPFCILTGGGGSSVGYGVGVVGSTYLTAATSAGLSNSGTNGWVSSLGRFYTPYTGKWYITLNLYFNLFGGGSRMVVTHFNSGASILEQRYCVVEGAGIGSDTTRTNSGLYYCSAGDFFTVSMQSGTCTLYFGGVTHTSFQFHFLG